MRMIPLNPIKDIRIGDTQASDNHIASPLGRNIPWKWIDIPRFVSNCVEIFHSFLSKFNGNNNSNHFMCSIQFSIHMRVKSVMSRPCVDRYLLILLEKPAIFLYFSSGFFFVFLPIRYQLEIIISYILCYLASFVAS